MLMLMKISKKILKIFHKFYKNFKKKKRQDSIDKNKSFIFKSMTNIETVEITKEEVLDRKMEEYVHRREHINFQKKEYLFSTRRYWKKKYNKRGRNCHKKEDIIKRKDREYKNTDKDEQIFFIFIKETKRPNKN